MCMMSRLEPISILTLPHSALQFRVTQKNVFFVAPGREEDTDKNVVDTRYKLVIPAIGVSHKDEFRPYLRSAVV